MECVDLKNEWSLWYHSINENKWDKPSYKELFNVKDKQPPKRLLGSSQFGNIPFFIRKNIPF